MAKDTFLIVMPAYNEEGCIDKVVSSWMDLIKKYKGSQLLIINDGSKDKTKSKLEKLERKFGDKLIVINKENEGHGITVRRGYEYAVNTKHDYVFQTDSDDQFSPKDFPKLWDKRKKSDFILGRRLNRNDPMHRIVITKTIRLFNILFFQTDLKDANVPFRLIKRKYLEQLINVLPKDLFAPNIFLSILASKDGQTLYNIPIKHEERKTGKISIVKLSLIKACLKGMSELFMFRMNLSKNLKKIN